jgi:hypothetical protein
MNKLKSTMQTVLQRAGGINMFTKSPVICRLDKSAKWQTTLPPTGGFITFANRQFHNSTLLQEADIKLPQEADITLPQ